MEWNEKYWDMMSNLYWTPSYMGWKRIQRKNWKIADGIVSVPEAEVAKGAHALYSREPLSDPVTVRKSLSNKEEILNHVFNITFAIASDAVIQRLFCEPLGIDDHGPFLSLGREILKRYGLEENVTQQDGLFVSPNAIVGVELKLGSKSWPMQIIKYAALMVLEEDFRKRVGGYGKAQLGLMFIVPNNSLPTHWNDVNLTGPHIDASFLSKIGREQLDKKQRPNIELGKLLVTHREQFVSVLTRLKLSVVSWTAFRELTFTN